MKEQPQLPRPEQTPQKTQNMRSGPPHLPTNEEILPIVTVSKPNGEQKRITQEQLNDFETEFYLATHLPHGKSLGS